MQRVANAAEEAVESRRLSEDKASNRHEEITRLLRALWVRQATLQATMHQLVDLLGPFPLPEEPASEASIDP